MMKPNKHLLIHNTSQLLTLSGGAQRGEGLGSLGLIEGGMVVIEGERILAVGSNEKSFAKQFPQASTFDAQGHVVMPGFVDPHTHLVWAGDRAAEFEMRLQGKTYLEILQSGGGILSTVQATRNASVADLVSQTRGRAWRAFCHGTTTAEVKTGYGLTLDSEIKQLQTILSLGSEGPFELVPTFLGAHAIPPEYQQNTNAYVDLICSQMLPYLINWWREHAPDRPLPFVDVFCERGAFDLAQSRKILKKAKILGFPLKIHADEFDNLGGAALAAELGAASADHLVKTSIPDIKALAKSNTVAVSLPGTPFGLGEEDYSPAKEILKHNGLLALATDTNPGTSWCESIQFIIALACRKMGLTPAQAIAATTINAAAAIQCDTQIGSIEPGKQADLLILETADYRHLGYRFGTNLVSYIIKQGRIYPVKQPAPETSFMTGVS